MKRITEWVVLYDHPDSISRKVNEMLDLGWVLRDPAKIEINTKNGWASRVAQVLVRYEEEPTAHLPPP